MYLQLVREDFTDKATEGKLFVNGQFECYTLEDQDRFLESDGLKIAGDTCIPRGVYEVKITMSNRFQKDLLEVLSVPMFTGIRIHTGNSSVDTEGCIIVGSVNTQDDDDWVGGSRIAYNQLHSKVAKALENGEEVTIEIV
jgi:hypothetical protein